MDVVNAIILGIIEGLTEFLPISSTGHMVIAMPLLGLNAEAAPWRALLWISQAAAILAVVIYFWRDLWRRTFRPTRPGWENHIMTKLVVAMVPTIVLALLFKKSLDRLESMPIAVAIALIIGAGVMEFIDRRCRRNIPQELEDVTLRQAFLLGLIQCISMIPGVSRAGSTIMGGMALGLTPRVATEFSFYLAIPTMLGAAVRTLWKERHTLDANGTGLLLVGCAAALIVALLVVAGFMNYVKRYRFTLFAVYRVVLGVAVLLYFWLGR